MATLEYSPLEQSEPIEATIWEVEIDPRLRYIMPGQSVEYYVSLGEKALGLLHWDINQHEGFIDGLDPHPGVEESSIDPVAWDAIAVSIHGLAEYAHLRRISHPAGSKVFLESLEPTL